ncbi:MAG: T9SS type A sorting domain-containing protein [Bacteroidota bacterium]
MNNLTAGTYSVSVIDTFGCVAVDTIVVESNPCDLLISNMIGIDESAPGAMDGGIDISIAGGTPPYTFAWSNGATSEDLSNLSGGTYSVSVSDSLGCNAIDSLMIMTLTGPIGLQIEAGVKNGVADNWVTVFLQNSYTEMVVVATPHMVSASDPSLTTRIRNAVGNSFELKVQNPSGNSLSPVDVYYTVVEAGVYNQADDGIDMEAFTFLSTSTSNSNSYVPEAVAYGNTYTNPVVLGQVMTENDPNWSSFYASGQTKADPPSATILNVSKHVGQDPNTSRADETLGVIVMEQGNGSVNGLTYTAALGGNSIRGVSNNANGFKYNFSGLTNPTTAVLSASGINWNDGYTPVLYGATPITNTQITLVALEDQLADAERSHNKEQVAYAVFDAPTVDCSSFMATVSGIDPSCFGAADGSAQANVSGGQMPYNYAWSNGATTASINGLGGGNYSVTITDALGCGLNRSLSLTEPDALQLTFIETGVTVSGASDGAIDLSVVGGTAPYTYLWSNGATTQDLSNISEATYVVSVTDNMGCVKTDSATIGVAPPPCTLTASASGTDVSCFNATDGSASVVANGGTPPYAYSWSNGENTALASNLSAGTYTVTVTDNNGCEVLDTVVIDQPNQIMLTASISDESGPGLSDGSIDLTVANGVAPYTFLWSNNETTEDVSGLTGGSYSVSVTDANSCTETTSVTIATLGAGLVIESGVVNGVTDAWTTVSLQNSYAEMVVVATPHMVAQADPTITSRIRNASGNTFELKVQNPSGNPISGVDVYYTVVEAGVYNATDDGIDMEAFTHISTATSNANSYAPEGVSYSNSYNNPVVLGQVMTENDVNWSVFYASGAGKADPPTASILNISKHVGQDPNTIRADETLGVIVIEQGSGSVNGLAYTAALGGNSIRGVSNSANGFKYNFSGLTSPTTAVLSAAGINWNDGYTPVLYGPTPISSTQITLVALEDQLADAERGHNKEQVAYAVFDAPTIDCSSFSATVSGTDPTCPGGNDGSAMAMVSGGQAPYTYSWSIGGTSNGISNLSGGTYSVSIADDAGCVLNRSVTLVEPAPIVLSFDETGVSTSGATDGAIDLTVNGGTAPYTYLWSNGATTEDITSLAEGTYSVNLTDANNCSASGSTTIGIAPPPCDLDVVAIGTDATCFNGNDGTASAAISGGVVPITYSWSNGANTASISDLTAGTYIVTATDNNGCEAMDTVIISQGAQILLATTVTDESAPAAADGAIDLSVSSGSAPYTFLWSNAATSEDISGLAGGTDSVTVTDAINCTETTSVNVSTLGAGLVIEAGRVSGVSDSWITVNLQNSYAEMVVVATPHMSAQSDPSMTSRIRNASGNSFELKVQNPSGNPVSGVDVYYTVVEAGVYTQAADGIDMEAFRFQSTVTSHSSSYVEETAVYSNAYTSPVVLGQVMTENDANWSTFYAAGGSKSDAPTASVLNLSKHVGQDPNLSRANETLGVIVIEQGTGIVNGLSYTAGRGGNSIKGPDNNANGFKYNVSGLTNPDVAVLSASGINWNDGYTPVLYGANPLTTSQITLVALEDQMADNERSHGKEEVAYLVIDNPAVNSRLAIPASELVMELFPNPASTKLTFSFEQIPAGELRFELTNALGQALMEGTESIAEPGTWEKNLAVDQYVSGTYWIRVWIDGEVITKAFTIQ